MNPEEQTVQQRHDEIVAGLGDDYVPCLTADNVPVRANRQGYRTAFGLQVRWENASVRLAHRLHRDDECACDREHADEWVEVGEATWDGLPKGARRRREWVVGVFDGGRRFVHRDDLPDPDPRTLIARHLGAEQANTFLSWLDKNGWTVTRKGER